MTPGHLYRAPLWGKAPSHPSLGLGSPSEQKWGQAGLPSLSSRFPEPERSLRGMVLGEPAVAQRVHGALGDAMPIGEVRRFVAGLEQ